MGKDHPCCHADLCLPWLTAEPRACRYVPEAGQSLSDLQPWSWMFACSLLSATCRSCRPGLCHCTVQAGGFQSRIWVFEG